MVLVPLAALAVLALALRPRLLRTFGVVVTVLAGAGFAGALLATNSGEALEESFRAAGQTIPETLRDHAEMGDMGNLVDIGHQPQPGRADYDSRQQKAEHRAEPGAPGEWNGDRRRGQKGCEGCQHGCPIRLKVPVGPA